MEAQISTPDAFIEEWKDIEGYAGRYQVSSLGNFVSITKRSGRKTMRGSLDTKGYVKITLYKNGARHTQGAHRFVAQAFIPNPENKTQVNHLDGDKQNNAVSNLEWCTNAENQQHKFHVLGYKIPEERLAQMWEKALPKSVEASRKPIFCEETKERFNSIKEAVAKYGTTPSNFSRALLRKKTAAGYHWRYANGD